MGNDWHHRYQIPWSLAIAEPPFYLFFMEIYERKPALCRPSTLLGPTYEHVFGFGQ